MSLRSGKFWPYLALILCIVNKWELNAQTFALPFDLNESSPAVDFAIDANGNMLERGSFTGAGPMTPLATAVGPQLVWSPAYASFQAGSNYVSPLPSNTGPYSIGLGLISGTPGTYSTGINSASYAAAGEYAIEIGIGAFTSGTLATALMGHAQSTDSIAVHGGLADGIYGVGFTYNSSAIGSYSTSIGPFSTVNGYFASAFGDYLTANGSYSQALGFECVANANGSTASGYETTSNSYCSFVTGTYNFDLSETGSAPSPTSWVPADPIFEVGNGQGTGSTPQSTSFVVYKNGDAAFPAATSTVTATHFIATAASGDIPAYQGNPQ